MTTTGGQVINNQNRQNQKAATKRNNAHLEPFLVSLGRKIQDRRKSLSKSQREIAATAELDRAYLSAVENGKYNVTVGALLKIASALETSPEELISSAKS